MVNAVYLLGKLATEPTVAAYENSGDGSTTFTKFVLISGPHQGQIAKIAVVITGTPAKIAAGFRKGQQVMVVGELQTYQWDEGGRTKEKTSLAARLVYPIEKRSKQ